MADPFTAAPTSRREQWEQVLKQLHDTWQQDPQKVIDQAARLHEGVAAQNVVELPEAPGEFEAEDLENLVDAWSRNFDNVHGGPDKAPKFPLPNNYQFLLRYAFLTDDEQLKQHVALTLDKMALGGINDQVGGGFARYSTDVLWKAPHFEKMLYDNAQLVSLYSQAYQAFQNPLYKTTVERTLDLHRTGNDLARRRVLQRTGCRYRRRGRPVLRVDEG